MAEGEEVRCVGDVLAAVAAVDRHTARAAAALVEVEYEVLPPVLDPLDVASRRARRRSTRDTRTCCRARAIRRGDADAALAASAHVVRGTWQTQRIEHLYLEPESALAEPLPDGRLHLYTQGQGIFDDRRQVAAFLGRSEDDLFVELVPNGGAFGGKEDMSVQAQTALLAQVTGRAVKLTLSREESIRLHPKRHPIRMDYTVGCDADGRLTAVKARMIGDSGAYASVGAKVLERAAGHACGPYRVPHVDIESIAAYTNNPPCGAMRGFGANQAHFAIEGCMDLLAEKAGLDRWEIRWRNALEVGDVFSTGQVLEKSVGIKKTLVAVKPHYDRARGRGARGRDRVRHEEQRHRQRREGVGQGAAGRRAGRHRLALQRLHRDGPGAAHGARAVRRRGDRPAGRRASGRRSIRPTRWRAARRPARARRCSAGAR